jgi:hypothetical protein
MAEKAIGGDLPQPFECTRLIAADQVRQAIQQFRRRSKGAQND